MEDRLLVKFMVEGPEGEPDERGYTKRAKIVDLEVEVARGNANDLIRLVFSHLGGPPELLVLPG